jgi:hypothetical protein
VILHVHLPAPEVMMDSLFMTALLDAHLTLSWIVLTAAAQNFHRQCWSDCGKIQNLISF